MISTATTLVTASTVAALPRPGHQRHLADNVAGHQQGHAVLVAAAVVDGYGDVAFDDREHRVAEVAFGHDEGAGGKGHDFALRREVGDLPVVQRLAEKRNAGEDIASIDFFHRVCPRPILPKPSRGRPAAATPS